MKIWFAKVRIADPSINKRREEIDEYTWWWAKNKGENKMKAHDHSHSAESERIDSGSRISKGGLKEALLKFSGDSKSYIRFGKVTFLLLG